MATVTELGVETWTTAAGNKTVTATPAVNDLIVIIAGATSTTTPVISIADNQGGTYTRICSGSGGGTGGLIELHIRNSLVSAAVSTIYTATITTDTGGGLNVFKVTGMSKAGATAALHNRAESLNAESPPTMVLGFTPLTTNACIAGILGEDSPLALTAPTGWTEATDVGYSTPTTGLWTGFRSSGETGSTISWTGGATTDHCEVFVELDTSGAAAASLIYSPGMDNALLTM